MKLTSRASREAPLSRPPSDGPGDDVVLRAADVRIHYWLERERTAFCAVDRIDIDIREGEFVVIVGPSGCGKTTFLDAVGGLRKISSGRLELRGRQITGPGSDRAIVFQSASLFPWKKIRANVAYGLKIAGKTPKKQIDLAVEEHLELVGLGNFGDSYPNELSGGMQQRANLARALVANPEMLLLDEPFGALDAQTRETMQSELLRIWSVNKKTALFITHDIKEAIYLADRVVVMSARPGRIAEIVPIDLPRPRTTATKREPDFLAYEDHIEALLEKVKYQ
ncbi:MAG: ABC transporter ATP-binding protein [Nocardioides sp.]|uniref:ABC transporter ATP-binding protein n=1 Tax=Nocardioides sp. TaxID=35761 RepID=UPI0039E3A7A4